MTTINLGKVVGDDGEDGRGIVSIVKTGTEGLVDTYTITYTDNTTSTFEVTNGSGGGGGTANYNELENKPSINNVSLQGNKSLSDLGVQEALTSGTNIKTVNNQSLLGSGNITIEGGGTTVDEMYTKNGLYGKTIAVIGDSISTQLNLNAVEITIGSQDVGVQLSAYPTIYDVNAGLTIGGHTFTSSEVGTEVSFTPTASDVGKFIGRPLNYNTSVSKTWWQLVGEEFGCTINPVCWSGSSISSHEASSNNYKTSYAWHDAQIRKCATRIPGSMSRTAPDLIIIYRGCNDMTHTPYAKLTSDTFSAYNWQYPETDVISDGYGYKEALSLTIKKLRAVYPDTQIFLATQNVFKRINYSNFPTNNGLYSLPQFNDAIREVADFFGCQTIDFDKDGITFENCYSEGYITDSATMPTHPSTKGHALMAKQAIKDLTNKLDLNEAKYSEGSSPTPTTYYTVTNNLTNTTTSNNATQQAEGSSYSAILTPAIGYALGTTTVTMGGTDITSTAYNNGVIAIANVTGNIVVTSTGTALTQYTINYSLTDVASSNNAASAYAGDNYYTQLSVNTGYIIDSVTVTMGGNDVTATVYDNNGNINIPSVTGNISISASAAVAPTYTVTNNLTNVTNNNQATVVTSGTSYNATLTAASGYQITSATVTMGGVDITSSCYTNGQISIPTITGNIVITALAEDVISNTYQIMDYIANSASGKEYIDTGVSLDANTYARENWELEFDCTSFANATSLQRGRLCGIGDGYYARDGITISDTNGTLQLYRGTGDNGWDNTGVSGGGKYRVEGFDWYKNDVKVFTNTDMGYGDFKVGSKTFTLFAYNTANLQISYMPLKIYSFKMWQNGVLVRDMKPCYRKSDNVPGMIDVVNKVFYQNAGTGSFTVGN